jgi:hypothetical protein
MVADVVLLLCLHHYSRPSILCFLFVPFSPTQSVWDSSVRLWRAIHRPTALTRTIAPSFRAWNWHSGIFPAHRKHWGHTLSPACSRSARYATVHCTSTRFHLQNEMIPCTQQRLMWIPRLNFHSSSHAIHRQSNTAASLSLWSPRNKARIYIYKKRLRLVWGYTKCV